ncbi:ki-ras-induced actin-interacting protein-IP3R-interacting domain olf186-M isoform X2 [Choristoneura fumiferana]|uniref:ki-ras-induced actin-interacting protein-IP3R-interacting domain olf186-M isoform X2 n=1 Tax=Choristoneura fumiferana TaxID=7141 RepID=UPI003D154D8F
MDSKQDTFNESVSTILERKVRGWLSGVLDDMRRSSPVQQWLDSLPADDVENTPEKPDDGKTSDVKSDDSKAEESVTENTVVEATDEVQDEQNLDVPSPKEWKRKSLESGVLTSAPPSNIRKRLQRDHSVQSEGYSPKLKNPLLRDYSLQSDASGSSGSSVLNVLGARKVDAESVLLALGFGPSERQQKLQRIPDRFLVPSKLKGISTDKFIKDEQHSMRMHDCGVFGYRGLTDHCTPVCRFMKVIPSTSHMSHQVPEIAVQESACSTVDNCS